MDRMNRYHWVLFDADHTLFDFDRASEEALSEVLAAHGVEWHNGMYADYKRINVQCWTEHEQGKMDRDTLVYQRFRRYFDFMQLDLDPIRTQLQYLESLGTKPYLMPGAESIIGNLKGQLKLGYITNGMTIVQRGRLEKIGWHLHFDIIVIAGEIGHSKPHEQYFSYVHEAMGRPDKDKVLVVGDSLNADIAGALAFGYNACWYNPLQEKCDLMKEPDFTIGHLDQLNSIVFG